MGDLTEENVEKICKVHFKTEDVTVQRPFLQSNIKDFFEASETKTTENFTSDMKKISFDVEVNQEKKRLNWVIKEHKHETFQLWMNLLTGKPFLKECYW